MKCTVFLRFLLTRKCSARLGVMTRVPQLGRKKITAQDIFKDLLVATLPFYEKRFMVPGSVQIDKGLKVVSETVT